MKVEVNSILTLLGIVIKVGMQLRIYITGTLIWYYPVTTTRMADTSIRMSRVLPHNH